MNTTCPYTRSYTQLRRNKRVLFSHTARVYSSRLNDEEKRSFRRKMWQFDYFPIQLYNTACLVWTLCIVFICANLTRIRIKFVAMTYYWLLRFMLHVARVKTLGVQLILIPQPHIKTCTIQTWNMYTSVSKNDY